ncbi:uncharacterized protein FFM5_13023 [Fusarium fujikuroi]|nr:uncharacterized protein FFM5_13023 [Fusarium fujikuroi]
MARYIISKKNIYRITYRP